MERKCMNWTDIKLQYPDMWVSLVEPEITNTEGLKGGIVVGSDPDKKKLAEMFKDQMAKGLKFKSHSFVYTGQIPNIVGLAKLEIKNVQV